MSGWRPKKQSFKKGSTIAVKNPTDFECPFCGKGCTVDDGSTGVVLHGLPPGPTYLRLPVEEFMKAVNDKLAGPS